MKYKVKILEVMSTVREIESPDADSALAKAESLYVKGEVSLQLETNAITLVDGKEEK